MEARAALPGRRTSVLRNAGRSVMTVAAFCRNKPLGAVGGFIVAAMVAIALLAPLIAPYGARELIIDEDGRTPVFTPPGLAYPMGTDRVGRDLLSRIIYGARISMYVGFGAVGIGVTGFFLLGIVSAYIGGWFDLLVQRLIDAKQALPGLVIALAIVAVLGPSLNNVILAIIIALAPTVVRTVRAQVLSLKEMDYILAAKALGATPSRIILRHIAPNCFAIYLVVGTYYLGLAIITESSLSFLGVGAPPDVPSWGGILTSAAGEHVTTAPWVGIFPGLAIFTVVLGFNLLGDALRDVLDPRLRRGR